MTELKGMLSDAQNRLINVCINKYGYWNAWAVHTVAAQKLQLVVKMSLALAGQPSKSASVTLVAASDLDAVPDEMDALGVVIEALRQAGLKPKKSMVWRADPAGKGMWNIDVKISW